METALEIVTQAKGLTIKSADDNQVAAALCKQMKAFQSEIEASYRPIVEKAHEAHKAALAELKAQLKPYEEGEKYLKKLMIDWDTAERERIAKERREREAEERRKAEEAALAEAAFLEATGDTQAADAVLEAPLKVAPVVAEERGTVDGASFAETWAAEVVDIKALCLAVAQGTVPPEYVSANLPALNAVARMQKQTMAVPGVKAVSTRTMRMGK